MREERQHQRIPSGNHGRGTVIFDDEEDSDEGMARNLLGIRGNIDDEGVATNLLDIRGDSCQQRPPTFSDISNYTNANNAASSTNGSVTVTQLFEPKFLEIFNAYEDHISTTRGSTGIDLSQHLMSLCLDHLVPFSCWARESTSRCTWIQKTLDDNIDLRPEVRNGLCMVFVYSFSAAKALDGRGEKDMFLVLQEPDTGLGIVNKTSLKIYNDPFCFFSFLKACMSGLIDAGKLPENERLNQPKKSKRQVELGEELGAFVQMKSGLVSMFSRGDNDLVREKIRQILAVWQYRAKSIRNRRFATALSVLSNTSPSSFLTPDLMTIGPGLVVYSSMSGLVETLDQSGYGRPPERQHAKESNNESDKSYERNNGNNNPLPNSRNSDYGSLCSSKESTGLMSLMNLSSAASCLQPFDRPHVTKPKINLHEQQNTEFTSNDVTPRGPTDSVQIKQSGDDNLRTLASLSDAAELTLVAGSLTGALMDSKKGKKRSHADLDPPANPLPVTFSGVSSPNSNRGLSKGPSFGAKPLPIRRISDSNQAPISFKSANPSEDPDEVETDSTNGNASDGASSWNHFNENDFITQKTDSVSTDGGKDGSNKSGYKGSRKSSKSSTESDHTSTLDKTGKSKSHGLRTSGDKEASISAPSTSFSSSLPVRVPTSVREPLAISSTSASAKTGGIDQKPKVLGTQFTAPKQQQLTARAMKSIRFERVGVSEWEMKESRIFDIESLLKTTDCVVSLVDESKFSRDEVQDLLLVSRSNGLVNLQSELQTRRALIASWPKAEHSNLLDFINEWRREVNSEVSLIKFWDSSAHSGRSSVASSARPAVTKVPSTENIQSSSAGAWAGLSSSSLAERSVGSEQRRPANSSSVPESSGTPRPSPSTGVVVYEVVIKVGFIIRACESLNILEDCWRVIYPRDLLSSSLQAPFTTFLGEFFPQLRSRLCKLENPDDFVVKYCAHPGNNEKLSQPPSPLSASCYQTIGTMNETAASMIGRLDANLTIHDFIIQF